MLPTSELFSNYVERQSKFSKYFKQVLPSLASYQIGNAGIKLEFTGTLGHDSFV